MDEVEPEPGEGPESVDGLGASDLGADEAVVSEKPEADAIEQAQPVEEERVRVVSPGHEGVPEADWLEQSVVEPLDEDEVR